LTHSGRLTHKVVTRQPWIRRRSGKVCRLQTDILTTEPRRQHIGPNRWIEHKTIPPCCRKTSVHWEWDKIWKS